MLHNDSKIFEKRENLWYLNELVYEYMNKCELS